MRTLLKDLRTSAPTARGLAAAACAVLIAGIIAAIVRAPGGGPAKQATVTRGWVHVVDHSVGFSALLPDQPSDDHLSRRLGDGSQLTISLARASHRIVVERLALSDRSTGALARVFRAAIDSLATGSGFQVRSEGVTTFRGQLAREGVYVTDTGAYYRALSFVHGAGDLYLIASPARYFGPLTRSFQALGP